MLKDTIISAFNYDGTLLKWLKKVEEALQGDTLTNIEVVTNSDYSMQLKLTFGDGTFILSPTFTNKGRGIVSISKTATSGLVDTYTVTYTDNTTSTFTVTNAEGFNANNLYVTLTAGTGIELTNDGQNVTITAKRLLSEIVDANGNKAFNSFNVFIHRISTPSYAAAKLSGYHFMIVVAWKQTEDFTLSPGLGIGGFYSGLPAYVRDKLIPQSGDDTGYIALTNITRFYLDNYGIPHTESVGHVGLSKASSPDRDEIMYTEASPLTLLTDNMYRFQFDLII